MNVALDDIRNQFVSLEATNSPAEEGNQVMLELEPDGELRTVVLGEDADLELTRKFSSPIR